MTTTNYIYFLQEREFIKTKENIYKIGRTEKENHKRFNQYPKGSILLFQMICYDCKNIEKKIIKSFKVIFKHRKDIGNEYFEGDYKNMIDIIYFTIKKELNINQEQTPDNEPDEKTNNEPDNESNDEPDNQSNDEPDNQSNDEPDNESNDEPGNESNDESNEESNDESGIERPIYKITTYNEWIKYNNISKIVITNKKREEGFLRYNTNVWRKLYDRNNPMYVDEENLLLFIKNNQENLLYKNKTTNEFITYSDYLILERSNDDEKNNYDGNFSYVDYNVEEILKDTLKKCFVKKYDLYNLNYNEYVFSTIQGSFKSSFRSSPIYVIYNSKNITFTPVDELINDKILMYKDCGGRTFYAKNIINTEIVEDILKSLVNNDVIIEYKKLVYNLIVEQNKKEIIFYDYNECLLTTFITDLLFAISSKNKVCYYDDKNKVKKLIKTNKFRCVVIKRNSKISIEKQINDCRDLNFKNIIVYQNNKQNDMYNIKKFRKYLNDNKEILIKCIEEENNDVINNWENEIHYNDDIFYKQNLLLTNFLKWCCIK